MSKNETNTMGYDDLYNEENVANRMTEGTKKGKRRYYPSNKPQTFVRNAVTGVKYPFMVGSYEQRQLYKMVDSTGTCDAEGYPIKVRSLLPNFNTNHLFYDSPEQCMSNLRISIADSAINLWRERTQSFD
jgi:hypothetical protein